MTVLMMQRLVDMVRVVNPNRTESNLLRRLTKIFEELGEASEAYLCVTSPQNYKNKTWDDYREEACDTLIVLIDVFLTEIEDFGQNASEPIVHIDFEYTVEDQMDQIFAVGQYVSRAAAFYNMRDEKQYRRSLWTACQAAANMCFSTGRDEDMEIVKEAVHSEFVRKLNKWTAALEKYAATDDGWK